MKRLPLLFLAISLSVLAGLWMAGKSSAQDSPAPEAAQGGSQAPDAPAPAQKARELKDFGPPSDANGNLKAIAKPARLDESDDKIEIVYFFWYGCPSCYKTDPSTSMFLSSLPDDVRVVKTHAMFDAPPFWRQHGRLYFVLDELGVEKDLHTAIFETIQNRTPGAGGHYTQGLLTPESQESFAAAHGVSRAAFQAAYNSPDVKGRIERVISFMENANLDGVPAFVINGRYQYSFFPGPGFYQQADELIAMERARLDKEREAKEPAAK